MVITVKIVFFIFVKLDDLTVRYSKCQSVTGQKQTVGLVEITTFKLNNGVSSADFVKSAEQMQNDFLKRQEGFIKRTLTQLGDTLWTDIVYWTNKESHSHAMKLAEKTEAVIPFMEKIDFNSVKMDLTNPMLNNE